MIENTPEYTQPDYETTLFVDALEALRSTPLTIAAESGVDAVLVAAILLKRGDPEDAIRLVEALERRADRMREISAALNAMIERDSTPK